MRNGVYSKAGLVAVIAAVLIFSSCHKVKDKAANGSIGLHLHTQIDTNEVDVLGNLYADHNGRLLALNDARFYISVQVRVINSFICQVQFYQPVRIAQCL